jgi:hypothetical protein
LIPMWGESQRALRGDPSATPSTMGFPRRKSAVEGDFLWSSVVLEDLPSWQIDWHKKNWENISTRRGDLIHYANVPPSSTATTTNQHYVNQPMHKLHPSSIPPIGLPA